MLPPSQTAFVPFVSVDNMLQLVLKLGIEKVLVEIAEEIRLRLESWLHRHEH